MKDLSGQKFGRWTVLRFDKFLGKKPNRKVLYVVRCECGTEKSIHMSSLAYGDSRSCGCLKNEKTGKRFHVHGQSRNAHSRTTEYNIWASMKQRCYNPNAINYERYGGRGIRVMKRWHNFVNFFADMGMRPSPKHQLDRFPDNDGNYEPGNVRWTTCKENNQNRRPRKSNKSNKINHLVQSNI